MVHGHTMESQRWATIPCASMSRYVDAARLDGRMSFRRDRHWTTALCSSSMHVATAVCAAVLSLCGLHTHHICRRQCECQHAVCVHVCVLCHVCLCRSATRCLRRRLQRRRHSRLTTASSCRRWRPHSSRRQRCCRCVLCVKGGTNEMRGFQLGRPRSRNPEVAAPTRPYFER